MCRGKPIARNVWDRHWDMTTNMWGAIRETLKNSVGAGNFANWIEPLELVNVSEGVAQFTAPTSFFGNYVTQNYADQIIYHLNRNGAEVERLAFDVRPVANSARPGPVEAAPVHQSPASIDPSIPDATLDPRYTFDNFVVGKPNELAHAAARRVAEGGPVTFNPLFLYGGVGLGKTHLMHAVAHEIRRRSPEMNVVYLSAEQFM